MNSDDFFDETPERPKMVAGRYRLPHPVTGVEQSWTRATTHAELPEDAFAITRWQLRQLLLGLSRRTDLLRLVESWHEDPGHAALDEVIKTAHEVAGNDAKANLGTAVHGVLQQVDQSWNPCWSDGVAPPGVDIPEWAAACVSSYVKELTRHGLQPIPTMTERRVVNLALGCAGTLDSLYTEADGTVVLGDKKTGRLDYPERKHAIQLSVYAAADYMLTDAGPPIDLRSVGIRQDYAVLVHVDPESGTCTIYRVDLRRGQYGANLASDVRQWRRERHLMLPYVAPNGIAPAAIGLQESRTLRIVPAQPVDPQWRASLDAELQAKYPIVPTSRVDDMDDMAVNADTERLIDAAAQHVAPLRTAEDLLKPTTKKEEVQAYCQAHGITDLAHTKKVLVDMLHAAGKLGTASATVLGSPVGEDGRIISRFKDPAELPPGPIGDGEDPTDPHTRAFHRARLGEIAAAPTVGELGRIHNMVLRVGGDQAWTDELTRAARARATALDAQNGTVRQIEHNGAKTPEEAIAAAQTSHEMAQIWNLVTIGGSDETAWTPELNVMAHARLAEIDRLLNGHPSSQQ